MRSFVFALLIALWISWILPFFLANRRRTGEKAVVTASAARWGVLLQGVGYAVVWGFQRTFWTRPPMPWIIAPGLAIGALAVACAWVSVPTLGKQWRVEAGLNAEHELVQSGPYRFVRHPIYASMLGMFVMTALILSPRPASLAAFAIFIAGTEIRVRIEDALLLSRFGAEFEAWRSRVPAYIPFIR